MKQELLMKKVLTKWLYTMLIWVKKLHYPVKASLLYLYQHQQIIQL